MGSDGVQVDLLGPRTAGDRRAEAQRVHEERVMAFERVTLGRTGLSVTRLGIAASYGTNEAMVEAAVERGVNYLWWGALRTKKMARGIKAVARKNREDLVIVVHAMSRKPSAMSKLVHKSLNQLGVDHLDVLLLAMQKEGPDPRLMEHAHRLRDRGLIRFLALSSHHRRLFPQLEEDKQIDIFHLRYNAANRGAEKEIFEHIPEEGGPGMVAFTCNRWGSLIDPASMPAGESPPSNADCYRFVLSHPKVHVACCGPSNMKQLEENLECLERGPMSGEELERMRRIGTAVYDRGAPWKAQLRAMGGILWPSSR
jgi:aryl-alcohol dehydrogenase-like predicted oxidoreductase